MTAAGLDTVRELDPLRERGYELISGPAGRMPTEDELAELCQGVAGWLAGVERISGRVLDQAHDLRVISRNGVGADAVDLDAASALGIEVALARGANSRGVAELALTLILAALRDVPRSNSTLHAGGWQRTLGREMPDVTVGVVGFGAIGRLVGHFAHNLGSRVLAYDPFSPVDAASGAQAASLDELFSDADVITLHSPPPADGRPLINGALLSRIRPGTILVNTARSSLVEDDAVLAALLSGRLGAYAVDAFDTEPPQLNELLRHERTILTPHLGGYTAASTRRATELSVANLLATLEPQA